MRDAEIMVEARVPRKARRTKQQAGCGNDFYLTWRYHCRKSFVERKLNRRGAVILVEAPLPLPRILCEEI
jgi:hypothetical protein